MTDMKEIARLVKQLEDQLVVCMRCGMCQAVCPLYEQTGREADVARGKIALLDGLMRELFADPKGVKARLEKCLLCGSCAANCPSGVSVMEIFLKARAILTGTAGLSPAKRLVLRGMLTRPALFDRLTEWGSRLQRLLARPVNDVVGTSCAPLASPLLHGRHFLPLAETPLHQAISHKKTRGGSSGYRVAFFVGCLIDKVLPRVGRAALEVLDAHGVDVFMPADQACCGIPALSSGDMDAFHRLVRINVERFSGHRVDAVLTACATCTSTIHKIWPMMLSDADPGLKNRAWQLAEKTMDISDFLVSRLGVGAETSTGTGPAVTYHDPCHLKKSLGVAAQPRALIRAARGNLVEMDGKDRCCGMGGSFNLQYYGISRSIGRLKQESILKTKCHTVATGCPACMMQISDLLSRAGRRISVRHAIEIYAESIRPPGQKNASGLNPSEFPTRIPVEQQKWTSQATNGF